MPDELQILRFEANPPAVAPGGSVELTWQTVGASRCALEWGDSAESVPPNGSQTVDVSQTTMFVLIAQDGDREVAAELEVTVES